MILISPVNIDDVLYCVNEQGNMRTERILTGDAYVNGDTTAVIAFLPLGGGYGTMKFGTICASTVTLSIISDGVFVDFVSWEVNLNGVPYDSGTFADAPVEFYLPVNMTPSPCGNIIEVVIGLSHSGSAIIAVAIAF